MYTFTMYPNIDRLDTLTFGGLKNGVQTLRKLLKKLGNPQDSYKVFHVAGTNGKWSVCQMLHQVLRKEFGYKVWLTISPHLIKLNERIQINSTPISDDDLERYLAQVYQLIEQEDISLSFFEHMILVAFLYFRDQHVDYAVIEVGLGGKYDATNVFTHPLATLITTISDDHRRLLWPSLRQIFWNKFGICKTWVPCFTRLQTSLIHRAARQKHLPLHIASEYALTNLPGKHQEENAWLVYHCLTTLGFAAARVEAWLQHITHPGRCQRVRQNVLIDGAHNEEWIMAFTTYVTTIRHKFSTIVTIFWSTKTYEEYPWFFAHLIAGDANYLISPAIEHRAVHPENYQHHLPFSTINGWTRPQLHAHLNFSQTNTLFIIYGSLYLAGEVIAWFENQKT